LKSNFDAGTYIYGFREMSKHGCTTAFHVSSDLIGVRGEEPTARATVYTHPPTLSSSCPQAPPEWPPPWPYASKLQPGWVLICRPGMENMESLLLSRLSGAVLPRVGGGTRQGAGSVQGHSPMTTQHPLLACSGSWEQQRKR